MEQPSPPGQAQPSHDEPPLPLPSGLPLPLPLQTLAGDVAGLGGVWAGAMPAFGGFEGTAQVELEQMSDAGLVRVTDLLARVRRDADALLARVAAEVANRSARELGDTGLARAHGFHNPVRLIAASTGASRTDAARLVAVGAATATRRTFAGESRPARHPHVAAALADAAIGVDAASAITSMLERVSARADPALADVVEAALVGLARNATLELLIRGVREAEARLDADGVEPREEQLRQARSLTIREDPTGMVHLHARLDPESAAPVKAAIHALVGDVLRRREPTPRDPRPVLDDHRTIPQLQADALAALARHTLGCTATLTPLVKTTVVVRVNLDTLLERRRPRPHRRPRPAHLRLHRPPPGRRRRTHPRCARRAQPAPGPRPRRPPVHQTTTPRPRRTRRRLRILRTEHRLRRSPPHQLVGPRHRTHRPHERGPALQLLPPHHPPRRLGHPHHPHPDLVHPPTPHRPPPNTPTRRQSPIPTPHRRGRHAHARDHTRRRNRALRTKRPADNPGAGGSLRRRSRPRVPGTPRPPSASGAQHAARHIPATASPAVTP